MVRKPRGTRTEDTLRWASPELWHPARACRAGVEGAVIVGKLLEKSEEEAMGGRLGYNAATGEFEDLVKAGVIDPLKVRPPSQCCRPWARGRLLVPQWPTQGIVFFSFTFCPLFDALS